MFWGFFEHFLEIYGKSPNSIVLHQRVGSWKSMDFGGFGNLLDFLLCLTPGADLNRVVTTARARIG